MGIYVRNYANLQQYTVLCYKIFGLEIPNQIQNEYIFLCERCTTSISHGTLCMFKHITGEEKSLWLDQDMAHVSLSCILCSYSTVCLAAPISERLVKTPGSRGWRSEPGRQARRQRLPWGRIRWSSAGPPPWLHPCAPPAAGPVASGWSAWWRAHHPPGPALPAAPPSGQDMTCTAVSSSYHIRGT